MRVLEVFGEPISHGGQESFVFNVLQHMNPEGLSIDVLTCYYCDNDYYRKMIGDRGGKIIELNLPFSPGKSRANIYKPLICFLKGNRYDTVHIHSGSTSVLALGSLAVKRSGVRKIIVHSHCAGEKKNLKYWVTKLVMTPILDYCPTDWCACSKEAGAWKFSRHAMRKLVILKNGVDLEKYRYSPEIRQKMREAFGISRDEYVIGHVGRFSYQKNQEFIIELLKDILNRGISAKAMLVGSGETLEQITNQALEYGIQDHVLLIGNVNNVQDYLQAMDVFLFPSRFEGLGIVGVEAQANGMPVLASTNVPKALQISSLVEYCSLEKRQEWIDRILQLQGAGRTDVSGKIRSAGYNISDTAMEVRNLYCAKA